MTAHNNKKDKTKVEVSILCHSDYFIGHVDEGSFEGTFTNENSVREYTGQFKDGTAQGKGVLTWPDGAVHSGDWLESTPYGYGELKYDGDGAEYYRGQWDMAPNGFGEKVDKTGSYLGQYRNGLHLGPVRHTSPDGVVKDTIWEKGKGTFDPSFDTGVVCDASEVAEKAADGALAHIAITLIMHLTCNLQCSCP